MMEWNKRLEAIGKQENFGLEDYRANLTSDEYKGWREYQQEYFAGDALQFLPEDDRMQAYKDVLASDEFKKWSENIQKNFARHAREYLPKPLTSIFAVVTRHGVMTINPGGTTNPEYNIILAFDAVRGVGMTGGCQTTFTDGAKELVERYKGRHREGRPNQCLRIAFMMQAVLNQTREKLPEGVAAKMEKDIEVLAPNGIPEDLIKDRFWGLQKGFASQMPIEFLGAPAAEAA